MSAIVVVIAIIQDSSQHILITQRPANADHGGLWEFPGGKVEIGEKPEQALQRELKEELGIVVESSMLIQEIHHEYPDKKVHLMVYQILEYTGQPACMENQQALCLLPAEKLLTLDFPKANQPIIQMLLERRPLPVL